MIKSENDSYLLRNASVSVIEKHLSLELTVDSKAKLLFELFGKF